MSEPNYYTSSETTCGKCGKPLSANAKFCPNCGTPVPQKTAASKQKLETIRLRCKGCGSVLEIDPDSPILVCPACGSKELILEDKDVTVARIQHQTEKERQNTYKEVELGRQQVRQDEIQYTRETEWQQYEKEQVSIYKKSGFSKVTVVFFVIFLVFGLVGFSDFHIILGIIALAQTVLISISWLMGMHFIPEKRPNAHLLPAIIAFILIIPFFSFLN